MLSKDSGRQMNFLRWTRNEMKSADSTTSRIRRLGLIRKQKGISLIEVLITLVVLSIGLLGIAALQTISLRSAQVSYQRTQAVNLAYEVLDVARANWFAIEQGGINSHRLKPDQNCGGTVTACWNERAVSLLPNGQIEFADGGDADGPIITVTVTWSDERLEDLQDGDTALELSETVTSRI